MTAVAGRATYGAGRGGVERRCDLHETPRLRLRQIVAFLSSCRLRLAQALVILLHDTLLKELRCSCQRVIFDARSDPHGLRCFHV